MKATAAMLVIVLAGCSATREIASGAVDIRANAESSKGRFEAIERGRLAGGMDDLVQALLGIRKHRRHDEITLLEGA